MTYRDIHAEAKASHDVRQNMYARGGEVSAEHSDVKQDRELIKEMVKKNDLKPAKRRDGGKIEGRARGGKMDRPGRATTINVIVPGGSGGAGAPGPGAMPIRPPMGGAPPPMPPPGAIPPHPMSPQAGMGPMPPPPGGPPMMPPRARGGKIDAGAASGVGRIEKAEGGFKGKMIERA